MNSLLVRIAPRFFKPSLAHSKRSIRLLALQNLDLHDPSQQTDLLNWLQQETEADLLQQALQRFPEPQPLIQLLESKSARLSEALHQQLITQLSDYFIEADYTLDQQQNLVSLITNKDLLRLILAKAKQLEIRLQAIQQLDADQEEWLDIALHNSLAKVRLEAAHQVTAPQQLEQLAKKAQGDKKVQRLARDKLAQLKAEEQQKQEAWAQKKKLAAQLEQLVNSQDQALFTARLEHLERQWSQLEAFPAEDQLEAQVQALLHKAHQEAARLAEEEKQARQREAERSAAEQQQHQLQQQLQQLVEQSRATNPGTLNDLEAQQQALNESWQLSQKHHSPEAKQQNNWQQLNQQLNACRNAWQRWDQYHSELAELLAAEDWSPQQQEDAHKLDRQLNWPTAMQLPTEIAVLQERLKQTAHKAAAPSHNQQAFDQKRALSDIKQLEQLLNEGQSQAALRLLQVLQQQMDAAPEAFRKKQATQLGKLTAQAAELKDWQGFVAAPKREILCEQMQALAEDHSMEPQAKADRIQALQQEWRELGSAAVNKDLWTRFKRAADQAYEPCKAWFAEQAKQREYNQEQRRIICTELEDLVTKNLQTQLDEEGLDQLLTQVHDEWRRFNPVNRAEGKRLAERFQQALAPIKDLLYSLRQEHAEQKRQLIAQAQELLQQEDLQAATLTSKTLQKQWRQLGRAPGSLEHQLWKEFRAACDQLFERRDQERKSQNLAREERIQEAREKLELAREALQAKQLSEAKKQYQAAAALRALPKQQFQAWQAELLDFAQQLEAAIAADQLQKQRQAIEQDWQQLPDDQPLADQDLARRLAVKIETLAGIEVPEQDQALKMQLQVERLNAGIKGEISAGDRQQEAQALFNEWVKKLGSREGDLAQRFLQALQSCYQAQ